MTGPSRGTAPVAALVAVLALPALALFGLWRFADGRTASPDTSMPPTTLAPPTTGAPAAALTTPLLSFRRVPGLMARDLNGSAFGQQAQAFADTLDATSCLVVALDGVPVASHNPDLPVIPASNQKLPVGAAALAALGPDFTFTTDVRAATPPSGGVLAGDLYLVGGRRPAAHHRRLPRLQHHPPRGDQPDVARHARRRGRGRGRHPGARRHRRRRLALRRRVLPAVVERRHPRHRGRADRRPARQRRPLQGQQRRVAGRQRPQRRRRRGAGPPPARTGGVDRRRGEHRHRAEQRHQRGEHRLGAAPGRHRRDDDHQRQQHRRDAAQGDGRALRRRRQHRRRRRGDDRDAPAARGRHHRHGRRRRLRAEHQRPPDLPPADHGARPAHAHRRVRGGAPGGRPDRARSKTCSPTRRSPAG